MSVAYQRRLFSVAEYHQMIKARILKEDDRVELINGEIINMPPISPAHASNCDRLNRLLFINFGTDIIIRIQSPIELNDFSEPEPDVAILKFRDDYYQDEHPKPADILLVIEVSDTTIDYDRKIKLPNYAGSNIVETWIVDIQNDRIESHRNPVNGIYQEIRIFQRGQQISCLSFPTINLPVDNLLRK